MNLPQLSADLAARVPEMAKDSPTNNAELIQGILSDQELIRRRECPGCAELKARLQMQTAEQINGPQVGRIDVKTSTERDEDQRIEIANLKAQLDAANKACAEMRAVLEERGVHALGCKARDKDWAPHSWRTGRDESLCTCSMKHALSSDCGKGYVSKEQAKGLVEALKDLCDEETMLDADGFTFSFQKNSRVHRNLLKALSSTKDLQ